MIQVCYHEWQLAIIIAVAICKMNISLEVSTLLHFLKIELMEKTNLDDLGDNPTLMMEFNRCIFCAYIYAFFNLHEKVDTEK